MNTTFQSNFHGELAKLSWRHEIPARREKFKKLTEGITNASQRRIVESLCESQLGYIRNMDEATQATDIALFKKYALKVIPRVYPALFIKDLISVQPIPLPVAKVFYMDFIRQTGGTKLDDPAQFDRTYANRGGSPIQQPVQTPPLSSGPTNVVTNELVAPKQIRMTLTGADISAESKALAYEFSAELNQDLLAYHGQAADPILSVEAAKEIQREIEYDIINLLLGQAGAGNVNWSSVPPANDQSKTIDTDAYNKTIFHAVVDARNLVFKKRYSYPNWMVCHPDMAVRFEKLNGFEYDKSFVPGQITQGRQFFGTIRNVISIYVDPWFPQTNKAVLGFKGVGDFDVGAAHCPYIPFYATAAFENPATLGTSRALLSRVANAMLVADMYSTLTITNAS